jgi:ParB family transcriptional regulator, chromosome partitioning protein
MRLAIIPIDQVIVGERFRKDLGDVEKFAQSIRDKGLINPLTVSSTTDSSGQEVFNLLAGGRRFAAAQLAGLERIPVRIYDRALSDMEMRSIELEENIQRKDMEWIEVVNLQREIHNLRQEIHGTKTSTSADAVGWSMRDTAKLLGKSVAGVSQDVKLANAVEQMPNVEWNECRSKSDAMKLLNRIEEAAIKKELVRRAKLQTETVTKTNGIDAARQRLVRTYVVGDFFEKVKKLSDNTFNIVEIDPPYGIDLGHNKRKTGPSLYEYSDEGYNEIDAEQYPVFINNLLAECYRVMADHSWLLLWTAMHWYPQMLVTLRQNGFEVGDLPALWVKPAGQTNQPNKYLASCYEPLLYARKGQPNLAKPGSLNTFHYSGVAAIKKNHPTERPLPLMHDILSTFAFTNSKLLVPFAGSGNTLITASQLGLHAVGYDLSEQFYNSFAVRVFEMGPDELCLKI